MGMYIPNIMVWHVIHDKKEKQGIEKIKALIGTIH